MIDSWSIIGRGLSGCTRSLAVIKQGGAGEKTREKTQGKKKKREKQRQATQKEAKNE